MKKLVILDEEDINRIHKYANSIKAFYDKVDKDALGLSKEQQGRIGGRIDYFRYII